MVVYWIQGEGKCFGLDPKQRRVLRIEPSRDYMNYGVKRMGLRVIGLGNGLKTYKEQALMYMRCT